MGAEQSAGKHMKIASPSNCQLDTEDSNYQLNTKKQRTGSEHSGTVQRLSSARRNTAVRLRRFLSFRRNHRNGRHSKKQNTETVKEGKESNLHKESSAGGSSNMNKCVTPKHDKLDEITVENSPSPCAIGLAKAWRKSLKDCNVTKEQGVNKGTLSPAEDELKRVFRPKRCPGNDDLTHDVLLHIIRCFPFPSPRPSPRASPHSERKTQKLFEERETLTRSKSAATHKSSHLFAKNINNMKSKDDAAVPSGGVSSLESALKSMAMNSVDTMAITALPLDCWLRERLKHWVQLSGHEGTIVPASDRTLWKKRSGTDCNEASSYKKLMNDTLCPFVPKYTKEVEYKGESFIEIEDLTSHFKNPAIMDIKIGTRTFLESEVKNPVSRKDLYQKMIKLDPSEPTEAEHQEMAVTKLRYMQFRERESSTAHLGFRIEAMKLSGQPLDRSFQKVKTRDQVMDVLCKFMGSRAPTVRGKMLERLKAIQSKVGRSEFMRTHEVIGSSLLFMFDDNFASAWMIDFAKALPVDNGISLDHRSPWALGNHEDGYLTGLDNLVQILEDSKHKELFSL